MEYCASGSRPEELRGNIEEEDVDTEDKNLELRAL